MKTPTASITTETVEQKEAREMTERIASNIRKLADSVSALLSGPLNRKALVLLLAHSSGMSQVAVSSVLRALENLKNDWLNDK